MVMSGEKAGGGNGNGSVAGAVEEERAGVSASTQVPASALARASAPAQAPAQAQAPTQARVSLRERKKQLTYRAISDAAVAMFLERGFDKVSVAEVAAAADISKPTLFRYFPAKEDLALHRFADREDEAARVVGGRAPGASPLEALRRHFLAGLDRRDPATGLCDAPQVLAFHRLLYGTPSLVARLYAYQGRSEAGLARALGGGVTARLAAGQVIAVLRILAEENWRRIDAGESADRVYAGAVQAAEEAFVQLRSGLEPEGRG
ncbi:transcriptional regulator, TetR family [Streptomyces sp. ScaeMP-e48]|uniref:TetR/AcrR family transcriptional regulator n=1 Tax=Streptomyces sp. ScaeMP-e48 TaxID=1100823 RepID=UPI0008238E84|nr:TetR family transcriptional regulator [Streptomyces sp. ScaeMP-e48]SCK53287.1 transcriptional regulator, TetR family [Streptomyces sp. ScaeMP-e48]